MAKLDWVFKEDGYWEFLDFANELKLGSMVG